jgi:outer membrane protein OmpA-like peptidoglycan-associated protein
MELLSVSGCAAVSKHNNPSPQLAASSDGFPSPGHALHPEGVPIALDHLRAVRKGMTKFQLYRLLGVPHFNEGVFRIREWNYIFDLPDATAPSGVRKCQYRIRFDDDVKLESSVWRSHECEVLVASSHQSALADQGSPELQTLLPKPISLSADMLFGFDNATLTEKGKSRLSNIVEQIKAATETGAVDVVGYTDRLGSHRHNRNLSLRRAESVAAYLVMSGISASSIHVEGRGEDQPVVQCGRMSSAKLIACLQPNRRVELRVTGWK